MTNAISTKNLFEFPIRIIQLSQQQIFVNLANHMLSLKKQFQDIGDKITISKQKLEQEIKEIDSEIDNLVYDLYGITEQEKEIIEKSLIN